MSSLCGKLTSMLLYTGFYYEDKQKNKDVNHYIYGEITDLY